jgi:hypothetical protein
MMFADGRGTTGIAGFGEGGIGLDGGGVITRVESVIDGALAGDPLRGGIHFVRNASVTQSSNPKTAA